LVTPVICRFLATSTVQLESGVSFRMKTGSSTQTAFPKNLTITAPVVLAKPPHACDPLVNTTNFTGKLVLVDGAEFMCGSSTKCGNVYAAGAAACIVDDEDGRFPADGIFGNSQIPSFNTQRHVGQALRDVAKDGGQATIYYNATTNAPDPTRFSQMRISVSKTTVPTKPGHWRRYTIGADDGVNNVYPMRFSDYPKVSLNDKTFFVTALDGIGRKNVPGDVYNISNHIVGLNRQWLVDGTYPEQPAVIPAAQLTLNEELPQLENFDAADNPQQITIAAVGSVTRASPTGCSTNDPRKGRLSFFVVPNWQLGDLTFSTVNVSVAASNVAGTSNTWASETVSLGVSVDVDPGTSTVQRRVVFGSGFVLDFRLGTAAVFVYRCALHCTSLWCTAAGSSGPLNGKVHWFEFDVAGPILNNGDPITVAQRGVVDHPGGNTSAVYPAIDVNSKGEVQLSYTALGPSTFQTFLHTGRLPTDPAGTMRSPPLASFQADGWIRYPRNPFIGSTSPPHIRTRYNDYTSLDHDPMDESAFYFYSECIREGPDQLLPPSWPQGWFTCAAKVAWRDVPVTLSLGQTSSATLSTPDILLTNTSPQHVVDMPEADALPDGTEPGMRNEN
jgi:hypothetical protein